MKILLTIFLVTSFSCHSAQRNIDDDLRAACIIGEAKRMQELIGAGANVNCKMNDESLLKYCLLKGSMDHFEILLKNGAELNELDEHGNNLLMQYVQIKHNPNELFFEFNWQTHIVHLIHKFDINTCNLHGNNFAHLLILRQKELGDGFHFHLTETNILRQAIFAGLEINKENSAGQNVYQLAIACGLKPFIKLIQDYMQFIKQNYGNQEQIDFAQAGKAYEEQLNRQERVQQIQRLRQKRCCIVM